MQGVLRERFEKDGVLAHLGERLNGIQEVAGAEPADSTSPTCGANSHAERSTSSCTR